MKGWVVGIQKKNNKTTLKYSLLYLSGLSHVAKEPHQPFGQLLQRGCEFFGLLAFLHFVLRGVCVIIIRILIIWR